MEQLFPVYRPDLVPERIYDELELPVKHHDRPYVAINMVSTLDGKTTLDQTHQVQKIGSEVDREVMVRLRSQFDGVLRGAETVRANPSALTFSNALQAARRARGQTEQPVSIVVSTSLDLPVTTDYFRSDHRVIVLTTKASDPAQRDWLRQYAEVEVVGDDALDADYALKRLRQRYGVERLLVEGGAGINYVFARAGLIDSVFWTLAPKVSGMAKDLTMIEGPELIRPIPTFSLRTLYHHENELFFHWSASW